MAEKQVTLDELGALAEDPGFAIAAQKGERMRGKYRGTLSNSELAAAIEGAGPYVIPQTPLDVALYALGGPFGRAAKTGALALGGLLTSDEAEAGPLGAARKGISRLATLGENLRDTPLWFWGSPGGGKTEPAIGMGQFETTMPETVRRAIIRGGYSVRLPTGEVPQQGFMAGIYPNTDPRTFVLTGRPTLADIGRFAETNLPALQKNERFYGGWFDPESSKTYLDVSQRFPSARQATKFGERTNQIGIYDVAGKETLPVGNWEQFIRGPEFRGRVEQMAREGGQYLEQFPQREWWNMFGSPFEHTYGTERLPQVAGFSASTAPNTAPIPNMQQMSEYVRRHIRGEPIIQPEWRAPEGLMSLAPGSQMPLEASRVANLEKAAAGSVEQLQRDKVRSEAMAMMGDPNAMVFDRHWARVAEKPSAGIYTGSEEGIVPSVRRAKSLTGYQKMEAVVGPIAREAGRDPRDFTADAWTGIRNTIQKTSQLFGEPYRGAAISGESKSYADHFVDLLRMKAEHMGMTITQLENRLRKGDASLMSIMLGSPTIAAAFKIWQADQAEQTQGRTAPASNGRTRAAAQPLQQ